MSTTDPDVLRRIWTPGREVEEVFAALEPGNEVASLLQHCLHNILQREGAKKVDFGSERHPELNTGWLKWSMVHGHHAPNRPELARREMTLWVEEAGQ